MDSFSIYDLKYTVITTDRYLGANFGKLTFLDESTCWWINGRDYISNSINLSKKIMEQKGKVFVYVKREKIPMIISYRPELGVSPILNSKEFQEYQQFIGIAHWIIELGRVDIIYEVSLLSSHLAMPRKGNMEALMVIFVYFNKTYGKTIIIDTMITKVDTSMEIETNWLKRIYGKDNQEEIPANTPEPLGNLMSVNFFVDARHAGEKLTCRSHTVIHINENSSV